MLRTKSLTGLSMILQSSMDVADEDEFDKNGSNKINLSNPFARKKSTGAIYLTSKSAKKSGNNLKKSSGNTKKSIKNAKVSNYLTLEVKMVFNHLRHGFT